MKFITDPNFDQREFDRKMLGIEIQLTEYDAAIQAAGDWMRAWRERQPKGFRALRGKSA